jgi:hypothetical protein
MIIRYLVLSAFLFTTQIVTAQIDVTANSLKSWLEVTQIRQIDTTGTVKVDLKTPGENRVWDFTNVPQRDFSLSQTLKKAGDTPFASEFPGANYALESMDVNNNDIGTIYNYLLIDNEKVKEFGTAIEMDGELFQKRANEEVTPLPIKYGATWETNSSDTLTSSPLGANITNTVRKNTVDAWGTMKLPAGEFECLRWRIEATTQIVVVVGDVSMVTGSFSYIEYIWISENSLLLATVNSKDDEKDLNFTDPQEVEWLVDVQGATSVENDLAATPENFELYQNHPNPFNPETSIRFTLPQESFVELQIFNMLGSPVRTLVSQALKAGEHRLTWNGLNEQGNVLPAGVYFYQLRAGNFTQTRKMTLVK